MAESRNMSAYAAKMRGHMEKGTDLAVDVRFIDMLADRQSHILDVGCGVGNAVNGLRARGHGAYGIDPSSDALGVAADLYDQSWFRHLSASEISTTALGDHKLPQGYDLVLMSGNVPAFLPDLEDSLTRIGEVLRPGGTLVIGTTTHARGGPDDQDSACAAAGLRLQHRFGNWHLGEFTPDSPWSVSVFSRPGVGPKPNSPDGMFILATKE